MATKNKKLGAGLGLYVHVPFCLKKCRYCDFVSYVCEAAAIDLYLVAIKQELALYDALLRPEDKRPDSIFIGGGTPTALPAPQLLGLLEQIGRVFTPDSACEITVEANPGTVNQAYLQALRDWGVNRLSLGVQSFQDRLLSLLGRVHTAREAVETADAARAAGFTNLNLDLIFGLPTQTEADLLASLQQAVALAPTHLAAYGLQLEPGTPLAQAITANELTPCTEDAELAMFQTSLEFLPAHGYRHYEISNYARPGYESRHNLKYWHNQPYLGLGPAAHSSFQGERRANEPVLEKYAARLAQGELPVVFRETSTPAIAMAETVITGLRLRQGVDCEAFFNRFGQRAEKVYQKEITKLTQAGLLEIHKDHLRLTPQGLPLGNLVFAEFV